MTRRRSLHSSLAVRPPVVDGQALVGLLFLAVGVLVLFELLAG